MPSKLYLVDTSAWLFALRKDFNPFIKSRLDHLLQRNLAITTGMIKLELLGGTKTEREFERLKMRLEALETVETDAPVWAKAANLAFGFRRQGITIPYTDILIASCALLSGSTVLHTDNHFDLMAEHSDLKVESLLKKIHLRPLG
jgi:predicted nucleic acid-binding protein